jgi:hypothetical protein
MQADPGRHLRRLKYVAGYNGGAVITGLAKVNSAVASVCFTVVACDAAERYGAFMAVEAFDVVEPTAFVAITVKV